ncbi:MAG: hypothetical protein K8E24_012110 [Methanobacterium paludis]|nr:hypothetical protein [Methanobacterium paludis]
MNKTQLNSIVNRYLANKDIETAKNYIKTWGKHIKKFDIEKELTELENAIKENRGYNKPSKTSKSKTKPVQGSIKNNEIREE